MSTQTTSSPTAITKACKNCGREFPLDAFPPRGNRHEARCRPCHTAWKRHRFPEGHRIRPQMADEVNAAPFVAWLNTFIKRTGGTEEAALLLGVQPRQLYRWTKRPMQFIPESSVDKVFCQVGEPYLLREMYPELYEDLAA